MCVIETKFAIIFKGAVHPLFDRSRPVQYNRMDMQRQQPITSHRVCAPEITFKIIFSTKN